MKRARTYEEIKPLIDFCKSGRLFDVQAWISEGKPLDSPLPESGRARKKSPLEIAIESGFHSMVEVLLDGGASIKDPRYSPLHHALQKRRPDLVMMLVDHGADIHDVDMVEVFDTWNNDLVEFFMQKGANLEKGYPLAYALCGRIRTALAIFLRYKDRFPSFQEQANIALRHHCKEGSLKWVSLMLWAGADPYAKGPDDPGHDPDPEEDCNALELAALFDHFEIFKLKSIHLDPGHECSGELLRNACRNEKSDLLKLLLDKGFDPEAMEDKGSSLMQTLLYSLSCEYSPYFFSRDNKDIDSSASREKIKMIHMLARKGVKWEPCDSGEIKWARRSLIKMKPDYIMEFIWIMSEYKACTREAIEKLMSTPSIRTLISRHINRYSELKDSLDESNAMVGVCNSIS